jgi:hypothetical protein
MDEIYVIVNWEQTFIPDDNFHNRRQNKVLKVEAQQHEAPVWFNSSKRNP